MNRETWGLQVEQRQWRVHMVGCFEMCVRSCVTCLVENDEIQV